MVALIDPKGQERDVKPAGVGALLKLGWSEPEKQEPKRAVKRKSSK